MKIPTKTITMKSNWKEADGVERTLALEVDPFTPDVVGVVFKGLARDFQKKKK